MTVKLDRLANGMQVITEPMSGVETVSLGIWLPYGSRDESAAENGMFHFIEHTLFKGTPDLSARDIAEIVEGLGGFLDAYTAKEETCYSLKVRHVHLDRTLEVLADMLQNPAFRAEEVDRERQVILEEIKMEEDNPEDVVYEDAVARFWSGHALARPILGTSDNVRGFTPDQVRAFHQRFYAPDRLVVAAAGKLDHDRLCARLEQLFPARQAVGELPTRTVPEISCQQVYLPRKHLEQINFCMHFAGATYSENSRHALLLLSTLLGGGMSSRLFQSVREEAGLAYHIASFMTPYTDCGQFTVYGACTPQNFNEVMRRIVNELNRIREVAPDQKELARAREQCNASLAMSLETTGSRAANLARELMTLKRVFAMDQAIEELSSISAEEVRATAANFMDNARFGLSALGRLKGKAPKPVWRLS